MSQIQVATKVHHFTFVLTGIEELTIEVGDAIYALIDDATLWSEGPAAYLAFHREAETLGDAIGSAVKDVQRAGYGVSRVAIEPDDSEG